VYDYRSPNDERRNDQLQTVVLGKFDTGAVRHDLTMGASLFRRTVDQTDAVFDYRGSDNIYNPTPLIFSPSPQQPGLSYRRLDSRQQSLFATDRMHFGERWQVIAGGRQIWLKEQAFDATGAVTRDTDRSLFLPQLALIYQPNKSLSFTPAIPKHYRWADRHQPGQAVSSFHLSCHARWKPASSTTGKKTSV